MPLSCSRHFLLSASCVRVSQDSLSLAPRSGFARFTNTRYSTKKEDITNTYMHLTNVAIQKHAPGFDSTKGMKWSIRSLRTFMMSRCVGRAASRHLPASCQATFCQLPRGFPHLRAHAQL